MVHGFTEDQFPDIPNWERIADDLTNEQQWLEYSTHLAKLLGLDKIPSNKNKEITFQVKCIECDRKINVLTQSDYIETLKWASKHIPQNKE